MKKGQLFSMDFFTAYGIFLVSLLILIMLSFFVAQAAESSERFEEMSARATSALDYICYGENFTDEPYRLKTEPVEWFFSQTDEQIRAALKPEWDYSLQLNWMNGSTALSAGSSSQSAENVVSYERVVYYKNNKAKLVIQLWEE